MGGVQSGAHNLGEALWVQERQRQRCHRENSRSEGHGGASNNQDRRKLLKRTRSLAVISEDESRSNRQIRHFRFSDATFQLPRRHQLIPRAKLIDRSTLKDRLSKSQQHLSDSYERFSEAKFCQSRTPCGLHSVPPGVATFNPFEEPHPLHSRENRTDPDRLNILEWPEVPRKYCSIQALDTVSGLVDIVEDNWPIEGNRSIDCIYTQIPLGKFKVKRKRKEHRSLDSILFEDEGELEYFDVLNLLPLSNVRLEFDEEDSKNNKDFVGKSLKLKALEYHEDRSEKREDASARNNVTDEEKCKGQASQEIFSENSPGKTWKALAVPQDPTDVPPRKQPESPNSDRHQEATTTTTTTTDLSQKPLEKLEEVDGPLREEIPLVSEKLNQVQAQDQERKQEQEQEEQGQNFVDKQPREDIYRTDVVLLKQKGGRTIEEAEDYKSIWISDNEDQDDMSRRPQVLKVIDSDVTKRKHRHSRADVDESADSIENGKSQKVENLYQKFSANRGHHPQENSHATTNSEHDAKEDTTVEAARNFFERRDNAEETKKSEGRFERIVKETSSILGKACSAVKGSLGFEARSESSDLGLGSESGSDTRRRSVDDDEQNLRAATEKKHSNLTRSKSCVDSIECQDDTPEFDHVRYKIVKSNVFSKNMFNCSRKDVTYEGLMQYLREYSFQELLLDNNVVIIEPVRAEPVELLRPLVKAGGGGGGGGGTGPPCKIAGAIQKRPDRGDDKGDEATDKPDDDKGVKCGKQSSIRKHFFYHPIRVNRELIDDELPHPDTVRNVRQMFEDTLKKKSSPKDPPADPVRDREGKTRKSTSMRDLSLNSGFEDESEKCEISRSRSSSRAKDLTRLFESMDKAAPTATPGAKDDLESPRSESKTRILAQSFEARSGQTSPSESNSSKKILQYRQSHHHHHHHHHHHWDTGSVSSGVSSDYPDTDPGSGAQCTSSEDEEIYCQEDDGVDEKGPGHYVSQDVLKKIRECGTSVTYYGGKVVNTCNGPLISPLASSKIKRLDRGSDYVKFRLVKSNSCDSRLELTGRVMEEIGKSKNGLPRDGISDLRECTIAETPSIEITGVDGEEQKNQEKMDKGAKREPPVVIGLEPKRDDGAGCRVDFRLDNLEVSRISYPNRFSNSALNRWQVNETNWKTGSDFGKIEFEEFEVLEDSLNGLEETQAPPIETA